MTPPRSALSLLRHHLAQVSRTREGDLALERFVAAGLETSGARSLSDFVHHCNGSGQRKRRTEVLDTLLALAPSNEIAALCALVVLAPDLSRMSRVLARGPMDLEEAESEVVAVAWQAVAGPPALRHRSLGPKGLLDGIWTDVRRQAGLRRRRGLDAIAWPKGFDPVARDDDPLERWPGLLAAAVAAGVLTPRQVVVIARSRIELRPLTEVAATLGRPYDAVCQERWRAESALRTFALTYVGEE